MNEVKRRRRHEKFSKRTKERKSSSEAQHHLASPESLEGVGLHSLPASHLLSPSSDVYYPGVATPEPPLASPPLRGGERESLRENMKVEKEEQDGKDEDDKPQERSSRISSLFSSFSSSPHVRKDELPASPGDERKKSSPRQKKPEREEGSPEKDQKGTESQTYLAFLRGSSSEQDILPSPLFYANRKFFIPVRRISLFLPRVLRKPYT